MLNNRVVHENSLLVFAKYPRPGKVKTRLTPPLSFEEGADLYSAFLCDSLEVYRRQKDCFESVLYLSDIHDADFAIDLLEHEDVITGSSTLDLRSQQGDVLGERLVNAFRSAFEGGSKRVCVIGTDHPSLPIGYVGKAFETLEKNDVVIGPAEDGGYYLIGMSTLHPELFVDMPWSQKNLYEELVQVIDEAGLSLHVLPSWYDVDDEDSLRKLMSSVGLRKIAPRTAQVIDRLESIVGDEKDEP
ncbi:MAG: TIGR04282 family arsenosugar biosynthesis glycosyltransferase [Chlorobi bacterium]|nr:TIGR04282 family arsenosugar biosynthesis glycosyltransferase [Chlorobiota bacterium]